MLPEYEKLSFDLGSYQYADIAELTDAFLKGNIEISDHEAKLFSQEYQKAVKHKVKLFLEKFYSCINLTRQMSFEDLCEEDALLEDLEDFGLDWQFEDKEDFNTFLSESSDLIFEIPIPSKRLKEAFLEHIYFFKNQAWDLWTYLEAFAFEFGFYFENDDRDEFTTRDYAVTLAMLILAFNIEPELITEYFGGFDT